MVIGFIYGLWEVRGVYTAGYTAAFCHRFKLTETHKPPATSELDVAGGFFVITMSQTRALAQMNRKDRCGREAAFAQQKF